VSPLLQAPHPSAFRGSKHTGQLLPLLPRYSTRRALGVQMGVGTENTQWGLCQAQDAVCLFRGPQNPSSLLAQGLPVKWFIGPSLVQ
jgi:hypothetical protein